MFNVCQCGADNGAIKVGAYWSVSGPGVNTTARDLLNIPISKAWDNSNSVCIVSKLYKGNNEYKFTNQTGTATNAEYNSEFNILSIKI